MTRMCEHALLLLALALTVGCMHQPMPAGRDQLLAGRLLLLPPLQHPGCLAPGLAELRRETFLELASRMHGTVVDGGQVPALPAVLQHRDLIPDGVPNIREIMAIGSLLECDSVAMMDVRQLSGIPPFQAAVQVVWVRVADGRMMVNRQLVFSMRRQATREDYREYLDKVHDPDGEIQDVAVRLSPRAFRQYVAARSIEELMPRPGKWLFTLN